MTADAIRERRRVLHASLVALFLGCGLATVVVLPAEYGVDPTGIGRAMGLLALSAPVEPVTTPTPGAQDAPRVGPARAGTTLTLAPGEGIEYKLRMLEGDRAAFRWLATGVVHYDMHGEPAGDTSGYYESYALGNADGVEGKFTALFDGTHGWYWRNDSTVPVEIELTAAGSFEASAPR
ncbi:MAG: hypothetical protein V2I82_15880 [Halieaceae bacterium]|jgi:hypothetical protein|nr:hypothetical protein [Halieaceae bacterium]